MRPLTIVHTEDSDGWGGQEIRILNESLGMSGRGHRVLIAAPPGAAINRRAREAGLEVRDVRFTKKDPSCFLAMRALLIDERADVLNTHSSRDSWVSMLAARSARKGPAVIRTRHLSTPIGRSFLSRLLYDTMTDAVLTTGEEIKRMMVEVNGFRAGKIFSVPTGIDLGLFDPSAVRPSLPAGGFSVGMVSVLRSWKGHEYFLRAVPLILEEAPEAVFYVAGEGPQRENIEALIKGLGISERVRLLGHREDVAPVLQSLDVVVHPSYANEGVPQGVLQAMAMKKPVVASDVGAVKEAVKDRKTGFLISPRDPARIAEKVLALYRDPSLRRAFGEEARKAVAEGHSLKAMLDRIEDIYAGVLGRG